MKGYYGPTGDSCKACPEGGVCPGKNEIYSAPGYFKYLSPKSPCLIF